MRTSTEIATETYVVKVNRGIDYILRNLERPVVLEEVARAAGFSPFHFHRIFKSLLGETFGAFVTRLRLERALSLLSRTPKRNVTDVAMTCGFGSSSNFSRAFKKAYKVAPSQFDIDSLRTQRRADLGMHVDRTVTSPHLAEPPSRRSSTDFSVRRRTIGPRRLAYLRVYDPFRDGAVNTAAEQLIEWAKGNELADSSWFGYMWDDPEVVELKHCRYDVAVEVPIGHHLHSSTALHTTGKVRDHETVCALDLPEMSLAEIDVIGGIDLEMQVLDWLFKTWLPESGETPAAQPVFEAWHGRPFACGAEHFEMTIQLPLDPR